MEEGVSMLVLALPFLALWFLFAGMETGVFNLSRWRIRQQMREGRRRAKLLNDYLDRPERFFWTILVGNTLATFLCVALVANGIRHLVPNQPLQFWAAFGAAVYLLHMFGDLLPKMLFRQFPNRLSMLAAVPFRSVHLLLSPAILLIEKFTTFMLRWTGGKVFTGQIFRSRDELREVMQESAEGLSTEERTMINRVLDLQTITLRQVASPLSMLPTLKRNSTVAEALAMHTERQIDIIPVWDEGARKVVGVLDMDDVVFSDLLDRAAPIREFVRPAMFLSQEMKIEAALRRMQRSGAPLAVVMGLQNREWGLVRVNDILRHIFGQVTL
ncbi:MAG TPA: CNNM domain-containing protein [Methylomirabilota bacterium]|nr:CNNM domain-containing protein [Methylomirabilota bacterium]